MNAVKVTQLKKINTENIDHLSYSMISVYLKCAQYVTPNSKSAYRHKCQHINTSHCEIHMFGRIYWKIRVVQSLLFVLKHLQFHLFFHSVIW